MTSLLQLYEIVQYSCSMSGAINITSYGSEFHTFTILLHWEGLFSLAKVKGAIWFKIVLAFFPIGKLYHPLSTARFQGRAMQYYWEGEGAGSYEQKYPLPDSALWHP